MNPTNALKTSLIDRILTIDDHEFLQALETLMASLSSGEVVKLTDEQTAVLKASEADIEYGRMTSQDRIDEDDLKWLSER